MQALDRLRSVVGAAENSPETHPMPGDKNKVLAAEDRQAPEL
jgi:hypothetical protein